MRLPRSRRGRGAVLLLGVVAGLALLASTAADNGLVYYRTPTELGAADVGRDVRVGGLVVPGSVAEADTSSTLVVTDGATDLRVHYPGRLPDVVREGQGAVVEGRLVDGSLRAEQVVMRHSNEYRPPAQEEAP